MVPWALLVGLCVGVLTGMFGVGGGFLITPVLSVLLGVPMPIAVGTGAIQILGVSTAGLYRRRAEKGTDYKMAVVLFGGSYVGVELGVELLGWLKELGDWTFGGQSVPIVEVIVLSTFLILLSGIAAWLWYDTSRHATPPAVRVGLFSGLKVPPYTDFDSLERPRLSLPVMCYFGLFLGFLTGVLGIGGGVVLVPGLVYLVGMRTQRAAATSLAMVWLTSFVATVRHATAGNTDLALAIPLLIGGSIGLQIGVSACARLRGPQLRRYFTFVVLAAAVMVAAKLLAIML